MDKLPSSLRFLTTTTLFKSKLKTRLSVYIICGIITPPHTRPKTSILKEVLKSFGYRLHVTYLSKHSLTKR